VTASPAPVVRPSLRRRVDQRMVAGVVGGIADWLNAPAPFLRFLVLVGSTFSQWVSIAYIVATLVIPARGRDRPGWDNLVGLGRFAVLFLGPALAFSSPMDDDLFEGAPGLWLSLLALELVGLAVVLSSTYPSGPTAQRARSSVLSALPLAGFAAVVLAGIALFPEVRWERAAPVGVLLSGAALIVGARTGRWRPLVGPAVVAALLGMVTVGTGARLQGGIGDEVFRTSSTSPPAQRVAVGDLRVVVTDLPEGGRPATVRASVGVGTLRVVLPRRARVVLDARVGRGAYELGGLRRGSGFGVRLHNPRLFLLPDPPRSPGPTVRVIAEVGLGSLDVHAVGDEDAFF
jgi:phage shock protein PspC (stress-responsive transcriptional regulator)